MTKKIRIAGPPGTGKTTSLVKIYYSHLKQYSPTDIIVISHTNTAADHIRGTIYSDKSIQEYQEDTKHEVFGIVKNAINDVTAVRDMDNATLPPIFLVK